jgi:hypothetical protein
MFNIDNDIILFEDCALASFVDFISVTVIMIIDYDNKILDNKCEKVTPKW